jgi:Zn-dependent M28 family amino/carboxypeptidase
VHALRMWTFSGVSLLLLGVVLQVTAEATSSSATSSGLSWMYVEPDIGRVRNEHHVETLGFDYRGSYDYFALVVGRESDADLLVTACGSGCRVIPFAPYHSGDELWVVESNTEVAPLIETLLAGTGMFKASNQERVSHIVLQGISTIRHLDKATFIPVPLQRVVIPDFSDNPIKANLARTYEADPTIGKLIEAVDVSQIRDQNIHLSNFLTRLSTASVTTQAQKWIADYFSSLGLDVRTEPFRAGYSHNIIAEIPGSVDPSKIVLFGAHYDSRSTSLSNPNQRAPGADDNGSGTVAVMEIARVFAKSKQKFSYTIRFCAWSGEEQGLYGSRDYASKAKRAGENLIATLNADMIGYRKSNTPLTIALDSRYVTQWLVDSVANLTKAYVPQLTIGYNSGCCSDQQSFYEQGFPAMGFFETTGTTVAYPHYHQSTDLPQYIDFEQLGLITKSAAATIATYAVPV